MSGAEKINQSVTTTWGISAIRGLHKLYKVSLSPFFGNTCRFYPACSDYALEALETHGFLKGTILTLKRLCRCHPYSHGWFDFVPKKNAAKNKNC